MLVINRPAKIESGSVVLDDEYRSARWTYHRLLDFEDLHQAELDRVAELVAPGIVRVGRILARLSKRVRRAERSTKGSWAPDPKPELAATLRARLADMRTVRNGDDRWKAALKWADEQIGETKQCRRKAGETDDAYAERAAKGRRDTRRDIYRKELYAGRRIYWGTWNGLIKAVEQARKAVLQQRARGLPAEWRRPKHRDATTLYADTGGFRVIDRSSVWWTVEMRIGTGSEWVRFRSKCDNWHEVPKDAKLVCAKLTRRKDGERWAYSLSLTVDAPKPARVVAGEGLVSFDWGHREHGHDSEDTGMRVFTWLGSDGDSGEILLPAEVRQQLDRIDDVKARTDTTFDARKASMSLPERNRYTYRRRLMMSGVRTLE